MRRLCLFIALFAAALWSLEPRLAAQKTGQVFVKLVDANGAPVTDLKPGDVSITEDGAACKTVMVEAVDWPVKLHVLVDNGKGNTNPINPLRYVVVNSGHTFGAQEFRLTNALLFPRLGDYAVFEVGSKGTDPKDSGYFDEDWEGR